MVVCTSTSHRATRCRVGCGSDGIGVESEVGHQGTVTRNVEGIAGIRGSHIAAFGPVGEGITCVGRGSQSARGALRVLAGTADRAAIIRVGRGSDGIGWNGDGDLLAVATNHGVVGGDDTDLVVATGHSGNLGRDAATGIGSDTSQFRGIVKAAIGIRHLSDNCIGSGVEVVGRHGSRQREGDGDGSA